MLPSPDSSLPVSVPRSVPPPASQKGNTKKKTLILATDESALSVPPSSHVDADFAEASFFSAQPPPVAGIAPELEAELARPSLRVARLMSDEAQAARARYRRVVSYVAAACVAFFAVAVIAAVSRKDSIDAPPPPLPVVQPVPVAELSPETIAAAKAPAVPVVAMDAASLRKRAERALDQGKKDEARALAESAIEEAPEQAEGYLLLGAAYELAADSAKAKEAYKTCAEMATRGPRSECQNLARR